jgi:hypothetical protein
MSDDDRLPMCAENLREGMRLGPVHYVITAEQVGAFAGAVRSTNSLYAGGSDAALAPPTMRLNDYALLIAEHFKGGKGGVHAKHRCEFHRPMRVGQSVITTGTITKTYRKRGKFYFELEYESRDAERGELLVRQAITSVLLNEAGEMR